MGHEVTLCCVYLTSKWLIYCTKLSHISLLKWLFQYFSFFKRLWFPKKNNDFFFYIKGMFYSWRMIGHLGCSICFLCCDLTQQYVRHWVTCIVIVKAWIYFAIHCGTRCNLIPSRLLHHKLKKVVVNYRFKVLPILYCKLTSFW